MKFRVLYFGRGPTAVESAIQEYTKRMPELSLERIRDNPKRSRFERMLKTAGQRNDRVVLDESGQQLTSMDLAKKFKSWTFAGQDVCFLLGDSEGFSDNVLESADFLWSLSNLTLPYSIARLLVCEQLYRARCIVNRHPYHQS